MKPSFSDDEFIQTLRAGTGWAESRDLTDVVGWADLAYAPEEALPAIRQHLSAWPDPGPTHQFPLPKHEPGEYRTVTSASPYDEAIFRALVGRLIDTTDSALGEEVKSYRMRSGGPGWTLRKYKYGGEERRAEAAEFIRSAEFGALGVMDVRSYYPSISFDHLGRILGDIGCNADHVEDLSAFLTGWAQAWDVRGLPIGPEASGVLGNAMLIPLDHELRRWGTGFTRYTDDLHLFLRWKGLWNGIRQKVEDSLARLGLEANVRKNKCVETRLAATRFAKVDDDLDRLDAYLRAHRAEGVAAVRYMMAAEAASRSPEGRRIRFALGVLASEGDPAAQQMLHDRPELLDLGPKQWGQYLGRLVRDGTCDRDWLLERALERTTRANAFAQYHLIRATGKAHLPRSAGERLEEMCLGGDLRSWMPIRVVAADAWSHADRWKPSVAARAAYTVGDEQLQRALVVSLRRAPDDNKRGKELRRLRTLPAVRPAVAWISSGEAA